MTNVLFATLLETDGLPRHKIIMEEGQSMYVISPSYMVAQNKRIKQQTDIKLLLSIRNKKYSHTNKPDQRNI